MAAPPCPICTHETELLGEKRGRYKSGAFRYRRCLHCRFAFVENPWLHHEAIYDERYYLGRGADPMVDYLFELDHPAATIRAYEWRGIHALVTSLVKSDSPLTWLDYGCGNGGLVRYLRQHTPIEAWGWETGWIRAEAESRHIPFLSHPSAHAPFDVVTAIEVLEHLPDPLTVARQIRGLLKPGGLFFYTTGNAAPHSADLLRWPYAIPEIHIALYEPRTLHVLLEHSGFAPFVPAHLPGATDVLRFKILKNLGFRGRNPFERLLPWPALARLADRRYQVFAHPLGRAI